MNNQPIFWKIVAPCLCALLMVSCAMDTNIIKSEGGIIEGGKLDAEAYYVRGNNALDTGQFHKAIEEYTRAIELDSIYADAYLYRGFAYNKSGQYNAKSIADYTTAIELIPNNGDAYKNRAVNFFKVGKCDEAWTDARKAQDLGAQNHPGFLEALEKQCPTRIEMSEQEAAKRLKAYWNSEPTEERFGMSVVQGQKEAIQLYLLAGLSVDSKHMGDPVLCHAVTSFQYDIARLLIEEGADVNATDGRGNPPLVLAVGQCGIPQLPYGATKKGINQLVQALVEGGADINATFRGIHSVYKMAGISKCFEIQETLRKAGAK